MSDGTGDKDGMRTDWSADELIPFGKYVLLDRLSSGATAAVYRANVRGEAGFERLVAIKRILPHMAGDRDFVDTFVREAKTVARLTHAAICPIYELGKVGESLYMAIEYIQGKDLGTIMRRLAESDRTVPPVIAAWIAARLCEALDYAHNLKNARGERKGIIHRDLSPSNVLISFEGQVKLIDFGLAKAVGRAQVTNVDALKKKISYMSPEMVKGRPLDGRSDLFGVGVCLYEMLTGRKLFVGVNDIDTLKLVGKASVPPPSAFSDETPEELELVVMHSLERDPADRFQDAAEMGESIAVYLRNADPMFGLQQLSRFMHEMFDDEIEDEQQRVRVLLAASADPVLLRERRNFFASPSGAAARARAEVERRLQAQQPVVNRPPAGTSVPRAAAVPREARESDDEKTDFYDNEKTKAAPVNYDPQRLHQGDGEATTVDAPPTPKPGGFEDEATNFYTGETELSDADVEEDVKIDTGGFDEEATTIFFNKEDGVGLQEMLDEINDVEEPPAPLNRPIVSGALSQPISSLPPARELYAPAAPTRQRMPTPQPAQQPVYARTPQATPPAQTYAGRASPANSTRDRILIALGLLLLLATGALVVLTPLGVDLGLRTPPLGAIELRTNPPVAASVRLDEIYRGLAPLRMEGVQVGPRRLSIDATGYLSVKKEVQIRAGATEQIEVSLVPDRPPVVPTPSVVPSAGAGGAGGSTADAAAGSAGSETKSAASESSPSRARRHRRRDAAEDGAATGGTQSATTGAPNATGSLMVSSVPWAFVWIDGRDTGRSTPLMGYPLQAGSHEVQLRTSTGQIRTERVQIAPGQILRLIRKF